MERERTLNISYKTIVVNGQTQIVSNGVKHEGLRDQHYNSFRELAYNVLAEVLIQDGKDLELKEGTLELQLKIVTKK